MGDAVAHTTPPRGGGMWLGRPLVFALLSYGVLAGCAGQSEKASAAPSASDLNWVLSGAGTVPDKPADSSPIEDLSSLMAVSPSMHRFALYVTRGKITTAAKIDALVRAMRGGQGLNLQYDANATLTAEQAFEQRRANCLSYTFLFAALARDVDIPVAFNDVRIPPLWDLGDNRTSLLYRHLNLRIDLLPPLFQVIDVSGEEYDPSFEQRRIPDSEAQAQYYNNRAMEFLLKQQQADALRYELRALQLASIAPYLWINLATIYERDGQLRAARIAVDQGLLLDPNSMLGYETAAQIYGALGQTEVANRYHQQAREFLERNPYYHYQLALAALDKGDESLSLEETRRAIQLRSQEPRFHFLLALLENRRGEFRLADDSMRTVMHLTQDPMLQERYRNKFARLKAQG
ncbi:MAG TPA: transglutaminase domain-containing protein [Nevskia sp.]|nr:transglutaminase domain-containing protein [Nevskia sp.]